MHSYNPYSQTKTTNKFHTKAMSYTCFKLEEKTTRNVKKKKSNFIIVIGDILNEGNQY